MYLHIYIYSNTYVYTHQHVQIHSQYTPRARIAFAAVVCCLLSLNSSRTPDQFSFAKLVFEPFRFVVSSRSTSFDTWLFRSQVWVGGCGWVCVPHCNAPQHTSTYCNGLQHAAAHRITLQHTATHCNTERLISFDTWLCRSQVCVCEGERERV